MKVQIIGVGVVGGAQAYLCSKLGHEVLGFDPSQQTFEYAKMEKSYTRDADVTFVCTPETAVLGVIEKLMKQNVQGLYVIKSTVPSGTTASLMNKLDIHICHNPEFLREENAYYDVMHPNAIVIGQCCPEHSEVLRKLYAPMGCPIVISNPTLTETTKLTLNSYLATLITFWNQVSTVSENLHIDIKELAGIVRLNPRVSAYGTDFFGSPFGGKCLPKDLAQLIEVVKGSKANPSFLEAVRDYNKTIRH
jgi:nucleotide sugar dehydrogenase